MAHSKRTSFRSATLAWTATAALSLALTLAGAAVGAAEPQEVKGVVRGSLVPDVYARAADPSEHRYNIREESQSVLPQYRELSANLSREVCIAAFGAPTGQAPKEIVIKVTGGRANPTTIVVAPKTRLLFKNYDPFPHTLAAGQWHSSLRARIPGNTSEDKVEWIAPDGASMVEIKDDLFWSFRLFVVVDPGVVDAWLPTRDGRFSHKLPPGDYTLKAFFSGHQVGKDQPVHHGEKAPFDVGEWSLVGGAK